MNHANMYAVGLALCTFADIASEEMARDLANEIEKLLGSSNTYIRKKVRSLQCAITEVLSYRRLHFVPSESSGKCPTLPTILCQKGRTCLRTGTMVYFSQQLPL